ncbi:MAG: glutamine-hydrolyzing GMP synthase [Bacilli bacterium]|nr:glutamine-hydrolyzing GMP synthase [Bacilli bacterium]
MQIDKIIVLDFGSQYNQLIARRIREMGVYSELLPHDISLEKLSLIENIKGIILSGGPCSVYQENSFTCDDSIFKMNVPILGICYGMQYIAQYHNGKIEQSSIKEYGSKEITVNSETVLFKETPAQQVVWMSHGDKVIDLPQEYNIIATSKTCDIAAFENTKANLYGVQFHPEVQNTEYGTQILKNFVFSICNAKANWNMKNYIEEKTREIQKIVGDEKVLMGISGGVDSSVAALLIHKSIGSNLTCMFIDHGLLRKNEATQIMEMFHEHYHINVIKIDAKDRFLKALTSITDPEQKRKIIGKEFIETFNLEAVKVGNFSFLGQGTLYTDIIESGTKTATTIKSHHNVGGLPKNMKFKVIEPLKDLFKDEVRQLGIALGIHPLIINRQPFPGPGLGIRIIGEITGEKIKIARESDAILQEEIAYNHLQTDIWQYFTVVTNTKSVGVMGDKRTYDYVVAIRAITSIDGMTADWARLPYPVLAKISNRIVNEVTGCNRVVFDITSKPPGTIEWE